MPETGIESDYGSVRYGDIDVCWSLDLEGGGRNFGQSFLPMVRHLFGKVDRIFEPCAGAGCIGFSLLANGHCDSLVLSDVNPAAVAAARETVRRNGLEDRVTVYESDGLDDVPADESCDLFVVNPPFFDKERIAVLRENPWIEPATELRAQDSGWKLHRKLYASMARFLRPGGSALLQETSLAVAPEAFFPMIEEGGLQHVRTLWYTENRRVPGLYFLWSKLASPTILMDPADPVPLASPPLRVELREPAADPIVLSSRAVHRLRLCNMTERPLSVRADLTGGHDERIQRTFVEIPAGGELALPPTTVGAGRHVAFRDERDGSILAEAVVAASSLS